mgnify:CR=1 FL=1
MKYDKRYHDILGLGLARTSRKAVNSSPLSKYGQWLRICIIVCFLCIFVFNVNLLSPSALVLSRPADPFPFSNEDFADLKETEETPSIFDYVAVSSTVNLFSENVSFNCVFSPLMDPENVTLHICYPDENLSSINITEIEASRFVHTSKFPHLGQYFFFISADFGNQTLSSLTRSFWITDSLMDKDADGMDDEWERYYGFDPNNPADASNDYDSDGYTNLDEFAMNTDPLDADYIEFMMYYIQDQFHLIFLTICFLLVSLLFSILGLRRSKRWI